MIDIMEHLQQYAPVVSELGKLSIPGVREREVHSDNFHHLLFGGDQLTAKRARGNQHVWSNSLREKDRLEGLKSVVEDWHSKVCLLGVSCTNITLHVRIMINVVSHVHVSTQLLHHQTCTCVWKFTAYMYPNDTYSLPSHSFFCQLHFLSYNTHLDTITLFVCYRYLPNAVTMLLSTCRLSGNACITAHLKKMQGHCIICRIWLIAEMLSGNQKSPLPHVKTFFELVCEAHICTAAMQVFEMSSLDDTPSSAHFPQGCTQLNPKQHWKVLRLAIKDIVEQFVDIDYPSPAKKDNDHVRAYAKEVLSLGLLLKEFVDAIREGDGERIIRCWRYSLPFFKCSDRKNYSVEAFNLLF